DLPRELLVVEHQFVLGAGLAAEPQAHPPAAQERDVAVAQGGQAVGAVLPRIGVVADPGQGIGQQRDHDRQYLVAGEATLAQVGAQSAPQPRQGLAEGDHPIVLAGAADLLPVGVVAVLLAATGIPAGRLQMAVALAADPHAGPGRRYRQGPDPRQHCLVGNRGAGGFAVLEAVGRAPPADARLVVAHVPQAGLLRYGGGVGLDGLLEHRQRIRGGLSRQREAATGRRTPEGAAQPAASGWPGAGRSSRSPNQSRGSFQPWATCSPASAHSAVKSASVYLWLYSTRIASPSAKSKQCPRRRACCGRRLTRSVSTRRRSRL